MLQEELTEDLRSLATELDELAAFDMGGPQFAAADAGAMGAINCAPPEIPDFQIVSPLGQGGMGAVYVARQESLGRDVAVKVVGKARLSHLDEARTVASLHHPNIVQVFAAGKDGDAAWFAMELVDGESADRHAFASVEEVARLGVSVAEALAYAHRCGILHRDVKPSNVFVGKDGQVKLGDFGLACLAEEGPSDKSGTKRFMAPELLAGGTATERSDQYALGVTLRDLGGSRSCATASTGGSQFTATATGAINCAPPPVGTPADFAAILDKATREDPKERYADMEAMLADLRRFLAHEPVAANPPSLWRRFRLFARRNPLAAFGNIAAVVCLVAFIAALTVGYVRISRALEATRREAEATQRALEATHREAAQAAQSLAFALVCSRRDQNDPRDAELRRALEIVQGLNARFPGDEMIEGAMKELEKARETHANLPRRPRAYPRGNIPWRRPAYRDTDTRD